MRAALAIAVLLISSPSAQAQVTATQCSGLAKSIGALGESTESTVGQMADMNYGPLTSRATGALKDASLRAQAAQAELVAAMRRFQIANEDLAYQLRVCAR